MKTETLMLVVVGFVAFYLYSQQQARIYERAPSSNNPNGGTQVEAGGDLFSSILATIQSVSNTVSTIAQGNPAST